MRAPPATMVGRLGAGLAKLLAGRCWRSWCSWPAPSSRCAARCRPTAAMSRRKGLKAPVEITRDKNAVPHIIAGSIEDAAFGLGFVHAQDRFWQMELMRRLGQGRLSEIVPPRLVGSGLIDTDRTMRGLGHLPQGRRQHERALARHARHRRRLCRRRERLARQGRPAVRPRTHPHQAAVRRPLPAGAVAAGRFAGVGQADGARARRQLAGRAAAAPTRAQDRRRRREVPDRTRRATAATRPCRWPTRR